MRRPYSIVLVPKRRVREFLARRRRDYRRWKQLTPREVEERQRELPFEPVHWQKLRHDQRVCFLVGVEQPRFAFFNDPSTGKTLLALTLARYHRFRNHLRRVLVLVPNLTNKDEWELEIAKHCPKISRVILSGSSADKWQQIDDDYDELLITVETYAGFTRMCCDRMAGADKTVLRPNKNKVELLCRMFQGVVMDECSEVKGHDSLIFRILRRVTRDAYLVLGLSGTPLGRDPTDLWAQMFLIDRGESLGPTLGLFRAAFFTTTQNHWGGLVHKFQRRHRATVNELLANRSIRYRVKDADLPNVNYIPKPVRLSDEAWDFYERATETLYSARGDQLKIKNTFIRMRQMSSGFVGVSGDEDGRSARIVFARNPKLELLSSIVASIPTEYPILIIHEFVYSGERIAAELRALGLDPLELRGGVRDPGAVRREFANGHRPLVLNWKAGGFGLNLQNAAYMLFYESPVSSIMRRQVEMRIRRRYSDWQRICIYDLMAIGTMDETIRKWHAAGEDLFAAIMDGRFRPDPPT